MKIILIETLIMISLASNIAFSAPVATPMSANHLFTACKQASQSEYARGFCDGAIDALYSSIQDWCVPSSVTHGEVKSRIMGDLLVATPQQISAFEFVNRSVQKSWPCY